ncbi:putative nuclear protein 1-like [Scophthalmus maximus]|nr:putative nuclear protein 1-like [Scophthalmus maximus]
MSHVDVKNLKPSSFEDEYYDQYEYYNLTDKYTEGSARKGRTKKEASDNTNRPNPSGHERKIVEKLQNSEKKDKEATRTAHPGHRPWPPWRQNETCGRRERRGAPMGKVPPGCEEEPKDPDVPAAVIFLLGCDGRRLLGLEGGQGAPGPCSDPDVAL